jgi:hypothetical protein
MVAQLREDSPVRNMGSRRHTASPGRTPVRSAVLTTVASPGPTPPVDSRVLAEGFMVAVGSMAEADFTEAEDEDSCALRGPLSLE